MSNNLSLQLSKCKCSSCSGGTPFFFPIKKQPIMLLTACPSQQAAYRPLTSVRFLRQVLYALFGINGVSEEGLQYFFKERGIYWTHFNKCYHEGFYTRDLTRRYAMRDLPKNCANKYLENEIEFLGSNLKLIIVMGETTRKNAENIISKYKNKANVIYTDYLQNESNTDTYINIRYLVANLLNINPPEDQIDKGLLETSHTGAGVHLRMEIEALEQFTHLGGLTPKLDRNLTGGIQSIRNNLDRKWIEKVIVPQKLRCTILVDCWNTIESEIKAFLQKEFSPNRPRYNTLNLGNLLTDLQTNARKTLSTQVPANERYINDILSYNWHKAMKQYLDLYINRRTYPDSLDGSYIKEWSKISKKLNILNIIRNSIVHNLGFLSQSELYIQESFNNRSGHTNSYYQLDIKLAELQLGGIKIYTNMIYLTEDGINSVLQFSCDIAQFLYRLDQSINKI